MCLSDARKARDTAKLVKAQGQNPVEIRKAQKRQAVRPEGDTFKTVALEGTDASFQFLRQTALR